MARPMRPRRGDELWCDFHHEWHHHTKFHRRRRQRPDGPVWHYDPVCKLAQQTQRVAAKHEDEAVHVVTSRAKEVVRKVNRGMSKDRRVGVDFVMHDLNYRALIPQVRVYQEHPEEVICPNCGYQPETVQRLHFDHRLPPRHDRDWARLHARNVGILDHECNLSKGRKDYAVWLDLEEEKRTSAAKHQAGIERQLDLLAAGNPFGDLPLFAGFA